MAHRRSRISRLPHGFWTAPPALVGPPGSLEAIPRAEAYRKQSARGGYKPRRDPRIRSPPKAALIAFRIAGN